MEVWDTSRILKMVVRQASLTVKHVEARLMLSCRCNYVIFFGPKGHFVMNKYLYYWTWNLVIILLLYVWFEHPGHTYGGFVPSFSERGMTPQEGGGWPYHTRVSLSEPMGQLSPRLLYVASSNCHTQFLSQNRMLIVCVPRNQVYTHTVQKMETE
jgi:hypothetical protein